MDRRTIIFVILMTAAFFLVNHFLFPPKPAPVPPPSMETVKPPKIQKTTANEERYVIQNQFQQLVVSNLGGALAEINLSFSNALDSESAIRKIQPDRILERDYPQSDYFPKGRYQTYQGSFDQGQVDGYYPLLRRDVTPRYYALATMDGNENGVFKLKRLEKNLIELEGKLEDVGITKTYTLPEDPTQTPYSFDFTVKFDKKPSNLFLTTGIPEVEIVSGSSTQSLKYRMTKGKRGVVEQISLPKTETQVGSIIPNWIANSNGFFALILDPRSEIGSGITAYKIPGNEVPTRLSVIDAENNLYPAVNYPGYEMRIPFKQQEGSYQFRVFAGPLAKKVLEKNDAVYKANYLSTKSFHGWFAFISEPFAKFLFFLMRIFYVVVRSWGIAIILLTVALRLMLYPLNAWSIKSTVKMQKLAPKLSAIQEKYKKDPKRAQTEIMSMYRSQGVNPLGGCFPLLIQMPFLIGMFELLKTTFELRGVSFIPGWINDLTAPDVIFSWSVPIWFIGNSLHLLPFLLGGAMFWQQKMTTTAKDPSQMTDQQKQQRFMGNIMTVVFTVLFYNFPSGLNIYWLSSMLLGILQQWWMTKRKNNEAVGRVPSKSS